MLITSPNSFTAVSKSFTELLAALSTALMLSIPNRLASKVAFVPVPSGLKPNIPYFCNFLWRDPSAYSNNPVSDGVLNCCMPLPAPIMARLKRAPSVPNFNLFFNLLKASDLPSLVSLSIMVMAKGSKDVPLVISANVPISSSATIASPTPAPTTAPVVGPIILDPIFAKLKYFPVFLASKALLAKAAALTPTWAPLIAAGPIAVIADIILPTVLASASSSKGFKSSKNFSTEAAVLVSPTKSKTSAPKDTTDFGIFIKPVATPASADSKKPTSSDDLLTLSLSLGDIWNPIISP